MMKYDRSGLSDDQLRRIYKAILKPRMIEEKMLVLLRQGKLAKWFSGIGQEAIAVGCGLALDRDEYILPMHRNLGVFTTREIPLNRLFSQWMGKPGGFTKGRDRSFHFGTQEFKIIGMISHLGPQLGVADGIALADYDQAAASLAARISPRTTLPALFLPSQEKSDSLGASFLVALPAVAIGFSCSNFWYWPLC